MEVNRFIVVFIFSVFLIQDCHTIEFEVGPAAAQSILGSSVTIECNAKAPLLECQWYWVSSKDNTTSPILVSTFPAYGNDNSSCSVRFKIAKVEQEGIWICGARESEDESFTLAPPFHFTILQPASTPSPSRIVQFAEITKDTAVKVGMPMHLICKTAEPVEECMWAWRANTSSPLIPIKRVEPFGDQHLNCDLRFDHVTSDDNGIWTCAARYAGGIEFTEAKSINVTIMTEVGFVQLSQDIQVSIGEPVFLRCLTNIGVEQCRWAWQAINSSDDSLDVIKEFPAYGIENRDCSIKLKNTSEEHAGVWRCQARLNEGSAFNNASPAKLTIFYPVEPFFLEDPQDISAALGEPAVLRCVSSSPMNECSWYWRPLKATKTPVLVKTFPPFDNYSRDCSVRFKSINTEQEGVWGCSVRGASRNITSRLAKLTVYDAGPISFVQLTRNILIYPEAPMFLRCTTSTKMEQCRWTWQSLNQSNEEPPKIVQQFKPIEKEGKDCTIRLSNVKTEEEGIWTCGVRRQEESEFTLAPSTMVKILHSESVTVAIWSSPKNTVTLACRLSVPRDDAVCRWYQSPRVNISETNHTSRYNVHHKKSTGVCTLNFTPEQQDLAQWACGFHVATQAGNWEMASANIILLTTATSGLTLEENKMGWLIGVLAMMVLVLTAALITVSVYQCCRTQINDQDIHVVDGTNQSGKDSTSRYTDAPTKINFQFREMPPVRDKKSDAELVLPVASLEPKPQHIYERVGHIPPNSLYENIDKNE